MPGVFIQSKEFYSDGRVLPKKPVYYQTREECDVWFSAEVVWEIRGAGNNSSFWWNNIRKFAQHPDIGVEVVFRAIGFVLFSSNMMIIACIA